MYTSTNPSAMRSQKELTDALITLMYDHPYNEITVKQILLESGLARKTFYRNFDSKDDVLKSLIRKILDEYFDMINNGKGDVLTTIFGFADRNRELLLLLDRNDMLHIVLLYLNEFSASVIKNQNKELNPFYRLFEGLDPSYLVALNNGAIWNVISFWVHNGMKDSPDDVKLMIGSYIKRITEI